MLTPLKDKTFMIIMIILGNITLLLFIFVLSFPYEQPVNGYVSEKIIKYYVIVDDCKIELTEDQFNYTGLGQWIDFKKAMGE